MSVAYLKYNEISTDKWNQCVRESYNGLIYSTSLYLDHVAGEWDALILNDYEAVMPLPWRKKWGVRYIYPPAFTQQLGVSSRNIETAGMMDEFLKSIPAKFRYVEMNFNTTNPLPADMCVARKNYVLTLQENYDHLLQSYSRSAKRNIERAKKAGYQVVENILPEVVVELHRHRFKDNIGVSANEYDRITVLINKLLQEKNAYCIGARNSVGNLVAGSIYTIFKNRVTFILNGNTAESLQNGATHLLMDHTIQKFSDADFILDFEGSDNPSFARFYEQYGAEAQNYCFLRKNNLPFPLRFLKKGIEPGSI